MSYTAFDNVLRVYGYAYMYTRILHTYAYIYPDLRSWVIRGNYNRTLAHPALQGTSVSCKCICACVLCVLVDG